jgi:hypothetical protein
MPMTAAQNGTTPNTADVRRYASRTGVNVNFERQLVPDNRDRGPVSNMPAWPRSQV